MKWRQRSEQGAVALRQDPGPYEVRPLLPKYLNLEPMLCVHPISYVGQYQCKTL